jgi:diguanylate cyclase (GGDEF)-like protein
MRLKLDAFRLGGAGPRRRAAELLGLSDGEMSPRAKAKLLDLLADLERMRGEADALGARLKELESLADRDPLADLLNRRAFVREVSRMLAFSARHGGPVSLLYIDLDGFKALNDRYGHRAGDEAIVAVSRLLVSSVRATDCVGRVGGDEFAAVLARADEAQARAKAQKLHARILEEKLVVDGATLALDASIGVYEARPGDTAEAALEAADAAMYEVKRAARRLSRKAG